MIGPAAHVRAAARGGQTGSGEAVSRVSRGRNLMRAARLPRLLPGQHLSSRSTYELLLAFGVGFIAAWLAIAAAPRMGGGRS